MMYVKVTRGGSMGGDFIVEATGPIESGSATVPFVLGSDADNDVPAALGRVMAEDMAIGHRNLETGGKFECPPVGHSHGEDEEPPTMWWSRVHVLAIERHAFVDYETATGKGIPEDGLNDQGFMVVKYAWWHDSHDSVCVITTRNIFIMSNTGQTIDRVR